MSEASKIVLFCTVLILPFHLFKPSLRVRLMAVLVMSIYVLYRVSGSPSFVGLMLAWAIGVYGLAYLIANGLKGATAWLTLYAVALLGFFSAMKMQWIVTSHRNSLLDAALPVGFSFCMFQSFAFLHDVRVGKIQLPSPLHYVSSMLFFPTLFAGPWQRFQDQAKPQPADTEGKLFFQGYALCCLGLFKFAISGFLLQTRLMRELPFNFDPRESAVHPLLMMATASVYLFTNFSGFSDIVVGLSRMMGFEVRPNFRFPFLSTSVADYWRRWHMSLGAWFTEYFYFPMSYLLAVKVRPQYSAAFAAFLTFVLLGLWHQYSMKFVVYAVANATCAVFLFPNNRNKWWGIPLTFFTMSLLNTLFLAKDLKSYTAMVGALFTYSDHWRFQANLFLTITLVLICGSVLVGERLLEAILDSRQNPSRLVIGATVALSIVYLFLGLTVGSGHVASVYVGY